MAAQGTLGALAADTLCGTASAAALGGRAAPFGKARAVALYVPRVSFADLIAQRRILICVGSGGVGKTTTAAALALAAARAGRHALVLTIDPARRLANSLGLDSLDHRERRIPDE